MSALDIIVIQFKEGSIMRKELFELVGRLSDKQVLFVLKSLHEIIGKR